MGGALLWALTSTQAAADPGEGIRSGAATVSPAVEFLGRYRTNPYLVEANTSPSFDLSLRPTFGLEFDGPEGRMSLEADYTARKYLTTGHKNLDRFNTGGVNALFDLFPQSVVGIRARADWSVMPRESEAENSDASYIQKSDFYGMSVLVVRPGSSMEFTPGGFVSWVDYNTYEGVSNTGSPNLNNRLEAGPRIDFKWKFFPKTAVVAGYRQSWFYWKDNFVDLTPVATADWVVADTSLGSNLGVPDGKDLHTYFGLRGRFTERVVLGLTAGYAQMSYLEESVDEDAEGEDVDPSEFTAPFDQDLKGLPAGIIANAEVGYQLTPLQTVLVGYRRDFRDIYFTNYVGYHSVYGEYEAEIAKRFGVGLDADYRFEKYVGEYERDDHFIKLGGEFSYAAASFLDIEAGVRWIERGSADGQHAEIEFDDVAAWGGLYFHY